MGVMVDGEWQTDRDRVDRDESGEFRREVTEFRGTIDDDGPHEPAAGRYHLYISRACPWAHRTTIVRALNGLEDAVSVDIVDPVRIDDGWEFSPEKEDCTRDTVTGVSYLRDVYAKADPTYTGRVTVPVLWDREEETIVNNESSEIIQLLDGPLGEFGRHDITLFPDELAVTETIDEIYEPINNGVYRAGFAREQAPYDRAVSELFDALEHWNTVLGAQRYLCGDRLTAADICLFTTLYRFDEVYHTHFKCNVDRVVDLPHLWGHTRELYQLPGVKATCNMDHIKQHYYRSHRDINPTEIVPAGPNPTFQAPHDRERLDGGPPEELLAST